MAEIRYSTSATYEEETSEASYLLDPTLGIYSGQDARYYAQFYSFSSDFNVVFLTGERGDEFYQSSQSYNYTPSFKLDFGDNRGPVSLRSGANGDILIGGTGDDELSGGGGSDVLTGGEGLDTAGYLDSREGVTVDLALTTAQRGGDAEGDILTGIENLSGSAFDDTLKGDAGDNVFEGGAGSDTLIGGAGLDTASYAGSGAGVIVSLASNRAQRGGDANGDVLTGFENLTGSRFNDTLTGDANGNVLDGGAGNDTLIGGSGGDTLIGGEGIDTANYAGSSAGVDVDLGGMRNFKGQVGGDAAFDVLVGIENVAGSAFADTLTGDGGANALTGLAGNDTLDGGAGNDRLDGGTGADAMTGGTGNDIFYVDNAGDTVFEASGGGTDTVYVALVEWTLTADQAIEFVRANVIGDVHLTGNALGQSIYGGAGADILVGGGGADRLYGGLGDDLYRVDGAGTLVFENVDAGVDTIEASASFTLGANVENLTLTGGANLSGTGNGLANILIGNAGANTLSGGAGADVLDGGTGVDRMSGGAGDDTYIVDNIGDLILEQAGEGSDTVESSVTYTLRSNVETLLLTGAGNLSGTGNELANTLVGNSGANALKGGAGNDLIEGGGGADTLFGGSNAQSAPADHDTFVFRSVGDSTVEPSGRDTIRDFDVANDLIHLSFDANRDAGGIQDFAFVTGAFTDLGQVRAVQAGGNTLIEANVTGNTGADFQIVLTGVSANTITRDSFMFSHEWLP